MWTFPTISYQYDKYISVIYMPIYGVINMDDFSKWYKDRMKRVYPSGRRIDNNRRTKAIIIEEQSQPQYKPNFFERLMFIMVAVVLTFYLIWNIVIPAIIAWILANPITFIVSIVIMFGIIYLAGISLKKGITATGNGVIRLIRKIKR